jgi:hypothetical protein
MAAFYTHSPGEGIWDELYLQRGLWLLWFVSFVWLIGFPNQSNQTNQMNQINQSYLRVPFV